MAIEDYAPIECFTFDSSDISDREGELKILLTTDGYEGDIEGVNALSVTYFAQPSAESGIYTEIKQDEIINEIGTGLGIWQDDKAQGYTNAVIGYNSLDGDAHKIITVQCLPWDKPGNLIRLENFIQIMICENFSADEDYWEEVINQSIQLILYILEKIYPSISIYDTVFQISSVFKNYYNKNLNMAETEEEILKKIKIKLYEKSAVPESIKAGTKYIKNFYINKQLVTIKKNNKNTVKQIYNKFINNNKLSFCKSVPLVQKTFMKLTGTGIDFYNQKLLPQETLEYLTGNSLIPQWNILEENLLSSLSFQDINNLKINLWQTQNFNTIQVNQQTNTSITSNYLTYPTKVMYITQTQAGHNSRKYYHTDYPWDEAGEGGKIWFYCPCNEMYISRIWYSNGPGDANIIWLTSSEEVLLANGDNKIVTIMIIHPDNVDMEGDKIYKDSKFTRGEQIIQAGKSGYAEGIHFHLSIGRGKVGDDIGIDGNGNLILEGGTIDTLKPNEAFWIDPNFTEIINSCGLDFKSLPSEQKEATSEDD